MESWYLVYCKPKQEKRAQANLKSQGINSFFPTVTKKKTSSSKGSSVPLFPRYLFVCIDPYSVHFSAVKNTRGVSNFIRYGEVLQKIPFQLIELFVADEPITNSVELNSGDKVVFSDSCYQDIEAIYKQPDGELRSILLINLLNKQTEISVDNCAISHCA